MNVAELLRLASEDETMAQRLYASHPRIADRYWKRSLIRRVEAARLTAQRVAT
jgi:hypothetical protein